MKTEIGVGLIGFGTVGTGVASADRECGIDPPAGRSTH